MSLVVWLPLNGNLENQGLSNVTVTNNGTTVDNNGKIGKCYSFNGTNNYMTIPVKYSDTMTFALWYKPSINSNSFSSYHHIFDGRVNGNGQEVLCLESPSFKAWGVYTSTNLPQNIWTHICVVNNKGAVQIYVNGILVGTGTTTMNSFYNGDLYIGSRHSKEKFLAESMNDIRIYDHALSAKEVKELAKGLVLHYRLAGSGQSNLMPNTSNKIQSTNVTTNYNILYSISGSQMEKGAKYVYSGYFENTGTKIIRLRVQWFNSGSDRGGPISSININPGDKGFYYLPFTYPNGTYSTLQLGMDGNSNTAITSSTYNYAFVKLERGSVQTPWCPNPADSLYSTLGYNNNIEYDCSGYRRNGTKSGNITWDIDSPRYTTSYKFNGSSWIATMADGTIPTILNSGVFTISTWVKPLSLNTNQYNVFFCCRTPSGSAQGCQVFLGLKPTYIEYSQYADDHNIPYTFNINKWYHIGITVSNKTAIFYVNGTQIGSTSLAVNTSISNSSVPSIGADSDRTGRFNGNIADFRIYATALSAEDIAELYHSAVIIDNTGKSYAYEYFEAN